MQRLLREIFCISYFITFTYIYGNLFVLLMNKIGKENPYLLRNYTSSSPSPSLINATTTTTTIYNSNPNPNLKIHYPTMLVLFAGDDDLNLDM